MSVLRRFLVVFALAGASCGFSEATVQCQRAGAHLVACCPGYDIKIVSCGQLSQETSQCVLDSSCSTISDNGFCDASTIGSLRETLCPSS